jgi:hypothetical protein
MMKLAYKYIQDNSHPVNLVKVVRLQHSSTDNTSAICSSHLNLDPTEEDIEVALDSRGIALLGDGELCTKRSTLNSSSSGVPLAECRGARSEVGVEFPLGKTSICGTGLCDISSQLW